ncbi:hypothetical protein BDA99DRAFT_501740 [Phascolomyces articulosus]|uniref:Uncharacterized protein n=1 Tax=Phascolomyces articulosus TaxID=60185 RepID=A0AAD5PGH6_9FUNG|nr:hypothetical protein BDA99DRAFT_501740 [Phascolomyces articulosus]
MLRKPAMVVPDNENEEWNSDHSNNTSSQSTRPLKQMTSFPPLSSSPSSMDRIINSPEPEPTMSQLSKMATNSTRRHNKWPPLSQQRMSQSSGHFATPYASTSATTPSSLPRLLTETGLHKMARSHESQKNMHSSTIDHQSLMDALHSDSEQQQRRRQQHLQLLRQHQKGKTVVVSQVNVGDDEEEEGEYSTTTTTDDDDSFDRDSIELAVSGSSSGGDGDGRSNNSNKNDHPHHLMEQDEEDDMIAGDVGSETLMELLGAQKDLEQQMRAIEQQENENEPYLHHSQEEQEQEEFEMPSFIRILYMGEASEKDKRIFLKKLSQAFATLFHYDAPSWLRNPKMFKERKHHLLLMSLVPPDDGEEEEQQDNLIETCEDNGLSVIEADFTWSTSVAMETNDLTSMIERYVWLQCESARQNLTSWKEEIHNTHDHHSHRNTFDGFVYPDKAPNGIDLCVYFYDEGGNNDTKKKVKNSSLRVDEDMVILWRLKKLGIPIMPILSSGNNKTTSSPPTTTTAGPSRSQQHHHTYSHFPPHPSRSSSTSTSSTSPTVHSPISTTPTIDERRTQLADLLAQYKIRCVDISLSKLDVGRPPSFQKRKMASYYPSHSTIPGLEERLGQDWAASSMTTPAPYQILSIEQFAALDRQIVFSILKQSRQKALKREKVLSIIRTKEEEQLHHRHHSSFTAGSRVSTLATNVATDLSWIITSTGNLLMNPNVMFHPHCLFSRVSILLIFIIGAILLFFGPSSPMMSRRQQLVDIKKDTSWNLTAVIGMTTSQGEDGILKQSLSFIVELGDENYKNDDEEKHTLPSDDNHYECKIALPTCISQAPASPLAKLDIQFPYPVNFTQLDFQCPSLRLSEWQDSLEKKSMSPTSTTSSTTTMDGHPQDGSPRNARPKNRSYWEHLFQTTNYLLHHQTKILNLVFNSN